MTKNAAFALVFVCIVFPFTCTAEESRLEPIETVQVQPDLQARIKAVPSEGAAPVNGEDSAEPKPAECPWSESGCPRLLGLQFNGVYQNMPPFRSPYEGQNSLSFRNGRGQDVTHTYGVYLGSQLTPTL